MISSLWHNLKYLLRYPFGLLSSYLYEEKCVNCGCAKVEGFLCKTCAKDVENLSSFAQAKINDFKVFSAFSYKGTIKELIHKLKFSHKKRAAAALGKLLSDYFIQIKDRDYKNLSNSDFVVCIVPSHFSRVLVRGYNHVELIAKEFCAASNFNLINNFIIKKYPTKPQYKCKYGYKNKKTREKNIKGSFKINKKEAEKVKDKTLILIDDITTTGATLSEITNCLKEEKIKNIICLTVSKSIH